MNKKTIEDIIRCAIDSEIDAYNFYFAAAQRMTDPAAKALFTELAAEEKDHQLILANLDLSEIGPIPTYDLPDFSISENVDKPNLSIDMSFSDAIALAMKNEEEAMLLYAALAKLADNPEQKKLFQELSDMEKGHKVRLEEIYNNAAYAEEW